MTEQQRMAGLYDPSFEHDACGIGFVANIKGNKSHKNISDALTVLENMDINRLTPVEALMKLNDIKKMIQ